MKVFGVTGRKDMGKTTLIERLVAHLSDQGMTVSTVKHTHHAVDTDQPGRDSHRHRAAGASEVVLASSGRIAFMHELRGAPEWPLEAILARMLPADLVLVEGYKAAPHPKLEVYRPEAAGGAAPLAVENRTIRAIVGDPGPHCPELPVHRLGDIAAIAGFILARAPEVAR